MPGTSVHDFAGVIPDDKEAEIQAKARRLKEEYKTEIAVVTIDSLQGEESFDYSMRMARSWGIGSKDNEIRGLLILVSVKDRKTAFRTSRHIEGELPDSVTGGISREMNAHFKKGDFGGGLSLGMEMILERLKEVYEPGPTAPRASQSGSGLGWTWLPIVAVPALGLGYVALRRRRKRRGEEVARQAATGSGFRKWASTVDPSGAPRVAHKNRGRGETTRRPQPSKKKSPSSSTYSPPSYGSGSSDYNSSSSSYDAGSSSGSDSGYSGGSDFGGGGSDSSW
jgi:uncharacterized membrane protein YgcG